MFDWDLNTVGLDVRIDAVSDPGILIIVEKTGNTMDPNKTRGEGTRFCAFLRKSELETGDNENPSEMLARHLRRG